MPEQLLGRIIRASSNPGDLVLDPFAGTGTTGEAALRLGRRYFLIEQQSLYIEYGIVPRLAYASLELASEQRRSSRVLTAPTR
jgi:hypothetical protein